LNMNCLFGIQFINTQCESCLALTIFSQFHHLRTNILGTPKTAALIEAEDIFFVLYVLVLLS